MSGLAHPLHVLTVTQAFGHLGFPSEPSGWLDVDAHGVPRRYRSVQSTPAEPGDTVAYHPEIHPGTDYGCAVGTPVRAVARGRIVAAGTYTDTGEHYVMLRFHRDATWQAIWFGTHLSRILVPVGELVEEGQEVALSGASGHVTGPHLHAEVRRGAASLDPFYSYAAAQGSLWGRWSSERLYTGGDMAGVAWIVPNVS